MIATADIPHPSGAACRGSRSRSASVARIVVRARSAVEGRELTSLGLNHVVARLHERQALASFAALSQETRLAIVRTLAVAGPKGPAADSIAERMGVSLSNVLSHHCGTGKIATSRKGLGLS